VNDLLSKIRSRGFCKVVIRPVAFQEQRVPDIGALYPIMQKTSVQYRGWEFPHLDNNIPYHVDLDWIGQEIEHTDILEIWRFYQSGQFVHLSNFLIDWRDVSQWWPADDNWKSGELLGVGEVLFRITEIFEFASRLALTEAGDDHIHIAITFSGLKNRTLWMDDFSRTPFFSKRTATISEFPSKVEIARNELIANTREHALASAQQLFKRFHWEPPIELLKELQSKLRK